MEILSTIITEGYDLEIRQDKRKSATIITLAKEIEGVLFQERIMVSNQEIFLLNKQRHVPLHINEIITMVLERLIKNIEQYKRSGTLKNKD